MPVSGRYVAALLEGYMAEREALLLQEQERTRQAIAYAQGQNHWRIDQQIETTVFNRLTASECEHERTKSIEATLYTTGYSAASERTGRVVPKGSATGALFQSRHHSASDAKEYR